MRKLRVSVIDLITKAPDRTFYARLMNANFMSIMPQIIAVWCEEEGHEVSYICYTGLERLVNELLHHADLVFIGAFTQTAQLAYALSNLFRAKGSITVLGGPHARCYPEDAQQYFDYVLGFTDKVVIKDVLSDCSRHRPTGICISAPNQPKTLPGVRERWKFIEQTLRSAPFIKIIPMIASMGCPYSCGFCIDSSVPYHQLDLDIIKEDLLFLLGKFRRPRIGWHDPNFGVRFDECMSAIEETVPPGRIEFISESSLSILSRSNLGRLRTNGFKAIMTGIESWCGLGEKTRTARLDGRDKVRRISEHVNVILQYIPFVQTNFVFGLDMEKGLEPFELTKRFVELVPGVFPAYCLLSAFGQAAPLNLQYQRDNRVLPFPFHFLNNWTLNVKPRNYSWVEFYDHVIDMTKFTFSWRAVANRYRTTDSIIPRWMHVLRAMSAEGFGRIKYYTEVRRRLVTDLKFRSYFEQESTELPRFYREQVRKDLGLFWEWLPPGALYHDPNAYLRSEQEVCLARKQKVLSKKAI